jgi:hypothetical protein
MNIRAGSVIVIALLGALICAPAFAGLSTVYNSDSGWFSETGYHSADNTNYYSGDSTSLGQLNDYFSFNLTGVSGPVTAASFNVASYGITTSGTYTIYATSLTPAEVNSSVGCNTCTSIFNSLTSGSPIGSIGVTSADSNTVLDINLNSSGLSWLTANEGQGIVLGGSFPQPYGSGQYAFGDSAFTASNNLTITTSTTPEPGFYGLMALGLGGLVAAVRRRKSVFF